MLRASASHIKFHSIHPNPIDYPSTINTNSPNASHPFYKHNTRHYPISYALKIDRVNILLDAGCPHTFCDPSQWLTAYAKIIHNIDGVLLSGPDIITCGAVPFLKKLRPDIEIVAMSSTSKVGLFTVLSAFQNLFGSEKSFVYTDPLTRQQTSLTLTSEDVYKAFHSIKEPFGFRATFSPVSYGAASRRGGGDENEQQAPVEARPSHNGQCLGGYIWVLSYQTDEITYAPSFSTKPSNYLKTLTRASMEAPSRCNVLLTDATAASIPALPSLQAFAAKGGESNTKSTTKVTDFDALTTAVQEGLTDDHDVIIPLDATLKGVEVLIALVKYFDERFLRYPIVFLYPHGDELLETVRVKTDSLNEMMLGSDSDIFARVNRAKTIAEVAEFRSPRVIVCDGADLDYGLGIEMLEELQRLSKPWTLCFTQFPAPWTNAGRIYAKFHPNLAQQSSSDDASLQGYLASPNVSSGTVLQYVCDSVKKEGGLGAGVFNRGRVYGGGLAAALSGENTITLSYTKRREYNREEQDHYLAKKEEEAAAAAAEKKRTSEAGAGSMAQDRIISNVAEISDDDDDGVEDGAANTQTVAKPQHTPGLFLPSHLSSFNTRHLLFPRVSSGAGESTVYGMALQDWERHIFSTRGHVQTKADNGPSHQGLLRNELLEYAKMPAHILRETDKVFSLEGCRCATIDMSNLLDVKGFLRFLKGFPGAKKVVFLRGSTVDTQKHIVTPLQIEQRSRAALVSSNALSSNSQQLKRVSSTLTTVQYYLQTSYAGKGVELASIVAAYDVRLAPALASLAQKSLCKVQERVTATGGDHDDSAPTQRNYWEIGWLHGYVAPPAKTSALKAKQTTSSPNVSPEAEGTDADVVDGAPSEKRKRVEFYDEKGALVSGPRKSDTHNANELTAEEIEQADIAALFNEEERAPRQATGADTAFSSGAGSTSATHGQSENGAEGSKGGVEKAAAVKTLHPVPASLEAKALVHMEQEGIVQGSVFVGSLSLQAVRDQVREMHRSILVANSNRANNAPSFAAGGCEDIASSMGGDVGADMSKYQSLIKSINLSTPDGSEVLSSELISGHNEALVLGYDTIVRQQGAASGRGEESVAALGDVAVEGVVSPNFFAVRELLYSQFARIL